MLINFKYAQLNWLIFVSIVIAFVFNDNMSKIVLQANKAFKRLDVDKKKEELEKVKTKYNISSEDLKK